MMNVYGRARQLVMAQVQRIQWAMMPELHVGAASLYEVPALLKERKVTRAMVLTTPGFVRRGTLAPFLKDALLTEGIETAVFSDISSDPDFACVERAAAFYSEHACDGMVAIGGGSVMDCAKMAGALIAHPVNDVRKLTGLLKVLRTTPPLIAVPTTAGTGSEVTAAAVVTDPATNEKLSATDFSIIPDVAVLDPALLVGLPPDMTAYSGLDALTHAVEAYINRRGAAEARRYAKEAVQLVFDHLKASYDDPTDLAHREGMLMASYYAGIAFTNRYVGYVHALAHAVGGLYHVPHGLACAVFLPVVLEQYGAAAEHRLAELASAVGIQGETDHEQASAFIAAICELSSSMGVPTTIPEIREEDVPQLAARAAAEGNPAYPVPVTWTWFTFEKVLRAVSGPAFERAADDGSQTRITRRGPLLDANGHLAVRGYATSPLLEYNRQRVRTSRLRIKEWDYYLVNDGSYALAFTISDLGYAALVSASLVDFAARDFTTCSTIGLLPLGRLSLPVTSSLGVTSFSDKRVSMRFEVAGGMRHLKVEFQDFREGEPLIAEFVLDDEPRDSMVIATPWAEDELAFYYNQKIVGMRAVGSFTLGALRHDFRDDRSFGLLDWGRGVWTRDNTWLWSAAQGVQDGRCGTDAPEDAVRADESGAPERHVVGFNLGYGFGDTSAATENMVFVDGVAHKLGRVDLGVRAMKPSAVRIKDRFSLMEPWHVTDDEGRLDLVFTPEVDRSDFVNMKLVTSDQHQVFGTFDGQVVLDDGTPFAIRGLRGFAEVVHNVY